MTTKLVLVPQRSRKRYNTVKVQRVPKKFLKKVKSHQLDSYEVNATNAHHNFLEYDSFEQPTISLCTQVCGNLDHKLTLYTEECNSSSSDENLYHFKVEETSKLKENLHLVNEIQNESQESNITNPGVHVKTSPNYLKLRLTKKRKLRLSSPNSSDKAHVESEISMLNSQSLSGLNNEDIQEHVFTEKVNDEREKYVSHGCDTTIANNGIIQDDDNFLPSSLEKTCKNYIEGKLTSSSSTPETYESDDSAGFLCDQFDT